MLLLQLRIVTGADFQGGLKGPMDLQIWKENSWIINKSLSGRNYQFAF